MKRTYNDMPMLTCPYCDKEFQYDDYCDTERGDEIDCPHCEKVMVVDTLDFTINVQLIQQDAESTQ